MHPSRLDAQPSGSLVWGLWVCLSAIPWLLPNHTVPWTTFHAEAAMALIMLPVAMWALWQGGRSRWALDALSGGFLALSLAPLLQAAGGMFLQPGEAPMVSLYLLAFALMTMVARKAEEIMPGRLIHALFAGIVLSGLLSSAIALYQWLSMDQLDTLIMDLPGPGDRPFANLAQPNNLATLISWALIGVWWAYRRTALGGFSATLAAAFLLFGMALTQSRSGWVALVLIVLAAIIFHRPLETRVQLKVWMGLGAWFVGWVAVLAPLARYLLLLVDVRSPLDQSSSSARLGIWNFALQTIAEHPWVGIGWNQTVVSHVTAAERFPLHNIVGHAHNAVLDLMLWCGIPLALCIVGGLSLWFWGRLRNDRDASTLMPALAIATFSAHALLELPHVLLFFLLPVAVMAGTLNALRPPATISLSRVLPASLVLVLGAALAIVIPEYLIVEGSANSARLRAARIGIHALEPFVEPHVALLDPLQSSLVRLRTEPKRHMSPADLGAMRRAAIRYPSFAGLLRYAQAAALNGHAEEAAWALQSLCDLNDKPLCEEARERWRMATSNGNPEMSAVALPNFR